VGPPPELKKQEVVHAPAEHEPPRVPVAREMTAEPRDGQHGVTDRGLRRHRTLGNGMEDVELRSSERS